VPWRGSFCEAVEEAGELLDRILRERLAMVGSGAVMLSGGLDSSTLAALLAKASRGEKRLIALTSVAPPGSGLRDERSEAAAVAQRLDLVHVMVVPEAGMSVYRPHPDAYRIAAGPSLSTRHYLYRALAEAAGEHGADLLFDGTHGEMTLTSYMPLATWPYRLRQGLKRLAGRGAIVAGRPCHVRLAPHRLAALEREVGEQLAALPNQQFERRRGERWGYIDGIEKVFAAPTLIERDMRTDFPFRDPRLLQLFAGFPADYLTHGGVNRAPARALTAGMLPEAIRLRQSHGAFSPDYMVRIRNDAKSALSRFPVFRACSADDWLDLDWLDAALQRVSAAGPASIADAYEIQLTAMAAEFLVWWHRGG
jgi:asparagine synthase (glutamine-hydrolysing)